GTSPSPSPRRVSCSRVPASRLVSRKPSCSWAAPRVGLPASASPRSGSLGARRQARASGSSLPTTVTSPTTSPRRSSTASTLRHVASCSEPRSSTASQRSSAMRFSAPMTAPASWPTWSARTSSSSPSIHGVPGTATTTSSATCFVSSSRRRLATMAETNLHLAGDREQLYVRTLIDLSSAGLLADDLHVSLEQATRAAELTRTDIHELAVPVIAVLAYVHYLCGDSASARVTAEEAINRPDALQSPHGLVHAEATLALLECDA